MLAALLTVLALQDSAAVLRAARDAQAAFEFQRRAWLPVVSGSAGGRCHERIGRFCYWYDPSPVVPGPEPPATVTARARLLQRLRAAIGELPGDQWLAGQEIRYLLEAGQPDSALAAVARCAAGSTWCDALRGLALHQAGRYAAADAVFSATLEGMAVAERCAWLDLGPLLEAGWRRRYHRLECDARIAESERLLTLARPLLTEPGNRVRNEVLARQVMARLLAGGATPHGARFDADHRELMLRYGWPLTWSRAGGSDLPLEESVIGHDPAPAWAFLPPEGVFTGWHLASERPRARFALPGITDFRDLATAQVARFPRPGGTLVVGAWRVPGEFAADTTRLETVLAVGAELGAAAETMAAPDPQTGVLALLVTGEVEVAGIEVAARDRTAWTRHRTAWTSRPTVGPRLSDLLFFDATADVPESLADVLLLALPGRFLRRGEPLGVYWEATALPGHADSAEVRMTLRREGGRRPVLTWAWAGPIAPEGALVRSVALDLRRLSRGRYHVELALVVDGRVVTTHEVLDVR